MVPESGAQFLKCERQLNFVHRKVVVVHSKINIGHVIAFKVYKGLAGGYSHVGATPTDFQKKPR